MARMQHRASPREIIISLAVYVRVAVKRSPRLRKTCDIKARNGETKIGVSIPSCRFLHLIFLECVRTLFHVLVHYIPIPQ